MKNKISDKIKLIPLSKIKPYENNAKIHSEKQIEKVKESILKNNYYSPIIVDGKNVIVAGHCRHEALRRIDPKQSVEVIKITGLKEAEIKKLRILDNKVVSNEWDNDALTKEIENIAELLKMDIEKIAAQVNAEILVCIKE